MIRRALEKDVEKIEQLLSRVCLVHHNGRPDIFKVGKKSLRAFKSRQRRAYHQGASIG